MGYVSQLDFICPKIFYTQSGIYVKDSNMRIVAYLGIVHRLAEQVN